ncbi:MAG: D-glycero-beta-D-manno-heptose-7-phosphate kinase [Nanoarchaeota archaeon]|nr:D-glycero-beta-D-manno-heptose-7-phosphate kinase [Nanoarchaeota archaeon]
MKKRLYEIMDKFKDKKIIVIGDIMLDKYIFGKVERISPEAPIQVVNVTEESYTPGGASNVANNIYSLSGDSLMVGVIGEDQISEILLEELKKRNVNIDGIFKDSKKPTTQKVRIIAQSQQLLRIDYENTTHIDKETESKIINFIKKNSQDVDAIIIADYAKGVITKNIADEIKKINHNKIIVVDPKPEHRDFYKGVSLIIPNLKEAREMTNKEDIEDIGKELVEKLDCSVLITTGEKGISLFEKNGNITNVPTKAKKVFDVSGAGDTALAALTLALVSGASIKEAAILSNHAAGIVVGKVGTSTVSINEIKEDLEKEFPD